MIEKTIMETVLHALSKGLNIDYRNISIIFNRLIVAIYILMETI